MTLRLVFLATVLLPFTLVGIPLQIVILRLRLPFWSALPALFFRIAAWGLGLRVSRLGDRLASGPVLLVSNHIGWLDIIALASVMPVSFVARSDLARWPVVGLLARLNRSIFVDRGRRSDTGRAVRAIRDRLAAGDPIVVFAEGTSSLGTHVLPFRPALFGAATQGVAIQPLAIAYQAVSSLPLSRAERRQIAWIGDMGMGDNLAAILASGPKDVALALGAPFPAGGGRRQMANRAHDRVRTMLNALNRGHPLPSDGEVV